LLSVCDRHFFVAFGYAVQFLFISVIFLHSTLIFGAFFAYFTVEIYLFLAYNVDLTGKVAVVC